MKSWALGWAMLASLALVCGSWADDKEAAAAKAGGEKSGKADKPKAPATAQESLNQLSAIMQKARQIRATSAEDFVEKFKPILAEFDSSYDDFCAKYAADPLRWDALILAADLEGARKRFALAEKIKNLEATLAECLAASDSSDNAKMCASRTIVVSGMEGINDAKSLTAWETKVAKHLTQFPKDPVGISLQNTRLSMIEEYDADRVEAFAKELAAGKDERLATMAKNKLKVIEIRKELASKPIDIKFTAVDGREFDMAKMRGKVVLIDFWATWCGPCIAELPNVLAAYETHHSSGFEIVGISLDEDKEALTKFLEERKIPWVQAFDGKGWQNELAQKYGINSIPAMWLVGADGKVIDFNARAGLAEKVAKELAKAKEAAKTN